MGLGAIIGGVGSVVSGVLGSKASKKAGQVQADSNREAIAFQRDALDKQLALQEPFRQGGLQAQNALMQYLGLGTDQGTGGFGAYNKAFGAEDMKADPGYQFRMDQGQQALERSAAARGNLLSGSALKGIQNYSQGLASQEYGNAFNRFQTERQARLNPLQSFLGQGQTASANQGAAIGSTAGSIAGNITGAGEARASGYVGSSNALSGALGNAIGYGTSYLNNRSNQNILKGLFG